MQLISKLLSDSPVLCVRFGWVDLSLCRSCAFKSLSPSCRTVPLRAGSFRLCVGWVLANGSVRIACCHRYVGRVTRVGLGTHARPERMQLTA